MVSHGESESGGNAASGGSVASGGSLSLGGAIGTGGFFATGGLSTGGGVATGGYAVTGGATGGYSTSPTGGTTATGGTKLSAGGTTAMGGTQSSVGGTTAMGGSKTSVGGTMATGGTRTSVGGTTATGGTKTSVGGTTATGGTKTSVGGATAMGGSSSMGGTTSFGGSKSTGGVLATGGTLGLGGTHTTGGAMNTGGTSSCPVFVLPNEDLIDDMDDGNALIPLVHGRAGAWSDYHDAAAGASMFPDPSGVFTMTNTGDSCRKYAAYVYGGPFVYSGPSFKFGLGAPYNASAYTGFSFWAKIDAGTSPYLRVSFPDKDTDPTAFICQTTGTDLCWDHFGHGVTLSTVWTKYTIPFTSLTQAAWGHLAAAFDPSTLFGVTFEISADATFGIWVDDVAFVY